MNYDPDRKVYRTTYGTDSRDDLCCTIVRSVGAVTNEKPLSVEPLYYSVDPEALEALVRSLQQKGDSNGSVEFRLNGCHVTVRADGVIELRLTDNREGDATSEDTG